MAFPKIILDMLFMYLKEQGDDFKAWFKHCLKDVDLSNLGTAEIADVALEALLNTFTHGKPPEG